MKKILVIAECINHNSTSEGISTTNFLNALSLGDYDVDCIYYQFPQFEIWKTDHISSKINLIQIRNNYFVKALANLRKIRYFYNKIFKRSLLRDVRSLKLYFFLMKHLQKKKYDLIFVRTIAGSIASHQAIYWISLKKKIKWISYFNDPVPVSMMPYPYYRENSTNQFAYIKDEKLVYNIINSSNGIASPSLQLCNLFEGFYKLNNRNIAKFVFPHIFQKPELIEESKFVNKLKLNFVHAGSLLAERNPEYLLKAFFKCCDKIDGFKNDVVLTFFGNINSEHESLFMDFCSSENIKIINERLPHKQAISLLNDSDVLILLEAISDKSPFMPTKLAEYIGLNKVIMALSPTDSETRRILGKGYLYQTEANNEDAIYNQFSIIYRNWKENLNLSSYNSNLNEYISCSYVIKEMNRIFEIID